MTSATDYAASDGVASATSGQLATFRLDGDLYGETLRIGFLERGPRLLGGDRRRRREDRDPG